MTAPAWPTCSRCAQTARPGAACDRDGCPFLRAGGRLAGPVRLAVDDADKAAIAGRECPACGAPPGVACLRSGGAIVGGSHQRFGEYLHPERGAT